MPKIYRYFNDKPYIFYETLGSKSATRILVKRFRDFGYLVRVVKVRNGWSVYRRKITK